MKELIYSEKYLKFIYQIIDGQIEAGKMIPAWVFKSDKKSCPIGRFEKLENEIRQTLLITANAKNYYGELANLKTLIEKVDLKAKEINVLHGEGKTDTSKYLVYSYSNENFGLVYSMEGVTFKHETRHGYFDVIDYFREVYILLETIQQPPATFAGFKATITTEKILSDYRAFFWVYETYLKNIEATIKSGFDVTNQVEKLSFEAREKKIYNIAHRAKVEISDLKYSKAVDFDKILFDVKRDILKLHSKIDEIIENNNLNHVDKYPYFIGFFNTINWFRQFEKWFYENFPVNQTPTKQTGFITTLHNDKLNPLFTKLIEFRYIAPGTDFNNFAACFNGLPLPNTFARVQWIKHPIRNKETPAKKALTDLLLLMGTPKEQTRDKTKLETCFCNPTGNPLKFTQSDFDNSKDNDKPSEYYQQLKTIISAL